MKRTTSQRGVKVILGFEGTVLHRYVDQAGYVSIGKGHKLTEQELAENKWPEGTTVTSEEAWDIFHGDMAPREAAVNRAVTREMTQNQFDAFMAFHFNTGAIETASITKLFNEGHFYDPTPDGQDTMGHFWWVAWDKCRNPKTGKVEHDDGLHKRRDDEWHLFMTHDAGEKPLPSITDEDRALVMGKVATSLLELSREAVEPTESPAV